MSVLRGDSLLGSSRRGQSTLLGMVLLIGMVAAGSLGIFLVAGEMLTGVEQDSEHERVEQAFVELSQEMTTVSSNEDVPQSMNLEVGDSGAVVMTDTGNLRIQGGDVDKNISIGAIEYNGDDGTRIAYQAGGVFRETGNQTRVVSAPPIQYDAESETLSFPIIQTRGEARLDSGDISVSHYETDPLQEASLVANDTVTIKITSEYYRGWEAYFEQQGGTTTVQDVEVHDNNRGTVTAEFGFREISDAFRTGAVYATEIGGNYELSDDMVEKAAYPSLNRELERVVNATSSPNDEYKGEEIEHLSSGSGTQNLEDGVYYIEGIEESDHLDFDLEDGDATLVVDGSVYADGDTITVSNYEDGNDLSIYVTGDYVADGGGNTCVRDERNCMENEDGTVIQMVASSESRIRFGTGGGARFEGIIYAGGAKEDWPKVKSCEQQICVHSNPNFYGSVVASSVYLKGGGGSIDFEYDRDLRNAELSIYPDPSILPPQITYLNVAEHQVDVEGN